MYIHQVVKFKQGKACLTNEIKHQMLNRQEMMPVCEANEPSD